MPEVKDIMDALGCSHSDGNVRGNHMSKILNYLEMVKQEDYKTTLQKLTLVCGMMQRYVRENYLEGIEAYGIISIQFVGNVKYWRWVGLKALQEKKIKNNGSE